MTQPHKGGSQQVTSILPVRKQLCPGFLAAGDAAWQHLHPARTYLLQEMLISLRRVLVSGDQGTSFLENKLFPSRLWKFQLPLCSILQIKYLLLQVLHLMELCEHLWWVLRRDRDFVRHRGCRQRRDRATTAPMRVLCPFSPCSESCKHIRKDLLLIITFFRAGFCLTENLVNECGKAVYWPNLLDLASLAPQRLQETLSSSQSPCIPSTPMPQGCSGPLDTFGARGAHLKDGSGTWAALDAQDQALMWFSDGTSPPA